MKRKNILQEELCQNLFELHKIGFQVAELKNCIFNRSCAKYNENHCPLNEKMEQLFDFHIPRSFKILVSSLIKYYDISDILEQLETLKKQKKNELEEAKKESCLLT